MKFEKAPSFFAVIVNAGVIGAAFVSMEWFCSYSRGIFTTPLASLTLGTITSFLICVSLVLLILFCSFKIVEYFIYMINKLSEWGAAQRREQREWGAAQRREQRRELQAKEVMEREAKERKEQEAEQIKWRKEKEARE